MKFTLHVVIEDDEGHREQEDILTLEKSTGPADLVGLSLAESKRILHSLQTRIVQQQAEDYTRTHRCCPECQGKRRSIRPNHHRLSYGLWEGPAPQSTLVSLSLFSQDQADPQCPQRVVA